MVKDRVSGLVSRGAFRGHMLGSFLFVFLPLHLVAQPSGSLFTSRSSFGATNHLVSVSVFHWFTADGGQLSGEWRPVEGRANWTGTTDFWQSQIKQMMAADIDMLYVHLIPSAEQQRINLFQALSQLRRQGWNVPKVAPFLDPVITWNQEPFVDLSTSAGKDLFVGQYIRFFNQYFSVNTDADADDYLARIDGKVVLDTWHVKFNLSNLSSLTRADVESRLQAAFAQRHSVFTNGIRMVTTALNDPTLSFADEKVPQFEITAYYYPFTWQQLRSVQLKGGYWDQNIRNPGSFLPRNGGGPYSNAWWQVIRARSAVHRAYLESWNEYDEGSGLYAANSGPPYIKPDSGNTNTDVWSSSNDAYEYIKTTFWGATAFNDWPYRDANILWHNIPTRMLAGETRTATVIVRNEGDALWNDAASYKFGQKEYLDPVVFGAGRYHLDDSQDDIPTYGGIFRGRAKTFTITLQAPTVPGTYPTHWAMLQELVAWFGEEIAQDILVEPGVLYHGAPQSIDSTSLFSDTVDDYTEHTYVAPAGPIGSFADCQITRAFAAPVKSVKLTLLSGTADDIGYVGDLLVTPDSQGTPPCAGVGHVTSSVDVSGQVAIMGNTATLTLRAQENCCCVTGWGEDTDSSRSNARLHWQVELWPPVPISPALSNSANGHFYVLLSPATWTWSERAATALGGDLTSIANQAEQDWVYHTFSSFYGTNRYLWIGFNDVATEGQFVWSSGEPVTFADWAPGEPNNYGGNEDFAAIYPPSHPSASLWNDWGERVFLGDLPFNGVLELAPPMGPPHITSQPKGGLVNSGATTTFSVGASGSPVLAYQWRRDGISINGATDATFTLTKVQFGDSGAYSVRVTNVLGVAISKEAVLTVNRAPVARCLSTNVPADANCLAQVSVENGSFDPDGDAITFNQLPAGPYPLGTNLVTLFVTDVHGLSSSCIAEIAVYDTEPPTLTCPSDIVITNAHNAWTSIVTFSAQASDNCPGAGAVVCNPAPGTAFGLGAQIVMCSAADASGNTSQCSFGVRVHPGNLPPNPVIEVSPLASFPGDTNLVVIAPDGRQSTVVFDGSKSSDPDDASFLFFWYDATNLFSTNMVARESMGLGSHTITLWVDDTFPLGTNSTSVVVKVISPSNAVRIVVGLLNNSNLGANTIQSLSASLEAAVAAFARGNSGAAANQLEAFQNKVRAQVAPYDAGLANELLATAQVIIDSLAGR
jgi:hypothetical protein